MRLFFVCAFHSVRTFSLLVVALALMGVLALAAACEDPIGLPPPAIPNRTDTVTLYARTGAPVDHASAYFIAARQAVPTDQTTPGFDFLFDIDTLGRAVLLPTGAASVARGSGIQRTLRPFDSVTVAPSSGYQLDSAVIVDSNSVTILHSRPVVCAFDIAANYYYYAKLHVLEIDTSATPDGRRITFEILNNVNCGYRGLEPGLPKR
jgi:hypothetical protein